MVFLSVSWRIVKILSSILKGFSCSLCWRFVGEAQCFVKIYSFFFFVEVLALKGNIHIIRWWEISSWRDWKLSNLAPYQFKGFESPKIPSARGQSGCQALREPENHQICPHINLRVLRAHKSLLLQVAASPQSCSGWVQTLPGSCWINFSTMYNVWGAPD